MRKKSESNLAAASKSSRKPRKDKGTVRELTAIINRVDKLAVRFRKHASGTAAGDEFAALATDLRAYDQRDRLAEDTTP